MKTFQEIQETASDEIGASVLQKFIKLLLETLLN